MELFETLNKVANYLQKSSQYSFCKNADTIRQLQNEHRIFIVHVNYLYNVQILWCIKGSVYVGTTLCKDTYVPLKTSTIDKLLNSEWRYIFISRQTHDFTV